MFQVSMDIQKLRVHIDEPTRQRIDASPSLRGSSCGSDSSHMIYLDIEKVSHVNCYIHLIRGLMIHL
ncbi:hypothetical protein HanPI659440_Chr03g0120751 [Helianthus annuus]|nr:hypothetical protein HanPI659440_Chr03g0120751 [Helianthus annuus]